MRADSVCLAELRDGIVIASAMKQPLTLVGHSERRGWRIFRGTVEPVGRRRYLASELSNAPAHLQAQCEIERRHCGEVACLTSLSDCAGANFAPITSQKQSM